MALRKGRSLLGVRLKEAGLTQRSFAKRLGVSESYVSKIVNNEGEDFSLERAVNAADILGCEVTDLNEWHGIPLSLLSLLGKE